MIASASGCRSSRVSKGANASIRQLLRHTSGIYNFTDNPMFEKAVDQGRSPWTPKRTLKYVKAPYFPPGQRLLVLQHQLHPARHGDRAGGRQAACGADPDASTRAARTRTGLPPSRFGRVRRPRSRLQRHQSRSAARGRFGRNLAGSERELVPMRPGPPEAWPRTPARSPSGPMPSLAGGCWRRPRSTR